jgi:hypothetical protein
MYKHLSKDKLKLSKIKTSQQFIIKQCSRYLSSYEDTLLGKLDKRLVTTFYDLFMIILMFRHNTKSLILAELGQYIKGVEHAPAGTKRISNLLRSKKWDLSDLEEEQLRQAQLYVKAAKEKVSQVLCYWDDSTIEKPESWHSEGLCAVHSSKASRITRIKPGYYSKPKGRICTPGYQWSAAVLGGVGLTPSLAMTKWWTEANCIHKDSRDNVFYCMLKKAKEYFDSLLTHVLDRGYASANTLEKMFHLEQNFIIRWNGRNKLQNSKGDLLNTYRICMGKRSMDKRQVKDKERKGISTVMIVYEQVRHPEYPDKELCLIVIRTKNQTTPMYLLTNCKVDTVGSAWEVFFAYIKRWDIEQAFRFNKSEMGIQSVRLWSFANRQKLMFIVTLVFGFLLQLHRNRIAVVNKLIDAWCPRTGNWQTRVRLPIYRLRLAISNALYAILINSG